jgi:hypothetical protein
MFRFQIASMVKDTTSARHAGEFDAALDKVVPGA